MFAVSTLLFGAAVGSAAPSSAPPAIGNCPIFPANNVWNAPIDTLPVHSRSDAWVASIGASTGLHPDFGNSREAGEEIGIPFITIPGNQPEVSVAFDYEDESDPGPYRIPPDALIEGGGDNHVLMVDRDTCELVEIFDANKVSTTDWTGGAGAKWNLNSNALRTDGWTSADAAGLPILPGLVRYDEVAAGEIAHALRFTVVKSQKAYLWPARHYASDSTDPNLPPMGARVRLKASVDISRNPAEVRVILRALQRYGMLLADNGSNWFVSGAPDDRWSNETLAQLKSIVGQNLEFVDESSLMARADSGEVRGSTGASVPSTGAAAPGVTQPEPKPQAKPQPAPPSQPQAAPPAQGGACDLQGERKSCPNGNLAGANLSGQYLENADVHGANLRGANLRQTYLAGANLEGADLTDADLDTATLSGANLKNAILVRTNLREADTAEADFTGATYGQTICNDGHVTDGPSC